MLPARYDLVNSFPERGADVLVTNQQRDVSILTTDQQRDVDTSVTDQQQNVDTSAIDQQRNVSVSITDQQRDIDQQQNVNSFQQQQNVNAFQQPNVNAFQQPNVNAFQQPNVNAFQQPIVNAFQQPNVNAFQQPNVNVSITDQQRDPDTSFSNQQQESGNADTRKRKNMDDDNRSANVPTNAPRRILGRYFPLTKTGYKYLNIGISLNIPSQVEIALGDEKYREIVLTFKIWKSIMNIKDMIFYSFDRKMEGDAPKPICFDYLTLRFSKINNLRLLRIETKTQRLAMSRDTVRNMFAMEFCVNHLFESLNKVTAAVDTKLSRFRAIVADIKNPAIAQAVLRGNPSFDKDDYIDSELFALMFIA